MYPPGYLPPHFRGGDVTQHSLPPAAIKGDDPGQCVLSTTTGQGRR